MKLTKSSQPLRYGIYCIARRALKLITEQLQYGIYCIAIVVLKLWATTIFITNINHLHKIGKDLKWRTTYLESASLPVKRFYEARGRRSRAYSWTSLPCLLVDVAPVPLSRKPQLHINHNFHFNSPYTFI